MLTSVINASLPRTVPGRVKFAIFFGQINFLIGFIFVLVGIFVSAIFIPMTDFTSFRFKGNEPQTQGVITLVRSTNSSENKRRIYEYQFTYIVNGKTVAGKSYSTRSPQLASGDTVRVEYLPDETTVARISGMRCKAFGPFTLFVLLHPLIGLVLLITGIRKARKNIYLLKNGLLAYGEVTGKEATSSKINNRRVYKVFFRFTLNGQAYESTARTHRPERIVDEKQEPLLYDPNRPEAAVLLDALPSSVRNFFQSGS